MNSRSDLIAETIAGACAALATAVIMDRVDVVKQTAAKVPRLGWKPDELDQPPILARLVATALASIVFRSTFSVTRSLAKQVL